VAWRFGREDVSTVGGLVLAELGHVPKSGEEMSLDGYRFRVDQVSRRRIRRVKVAPPVAEQHAVEAEATS
jgi:Mg2+/Co2+ transporter CorC